ncbi:hypothetical protein DFH09DRAFT_1327200 [Mycena vulgaris]|nr:hypothetical protein DFH09DRAFT_1327200 [Mycena vulgaris]
MLAMLTGYLPHLAHAALHIHAPHIHRKPAHQQHVHVRISTGLAVSMPVPSPQPAAMPNHLAACIERCAPDRT